MLQVNLFFGFLPCAELSWLPPFDDCPLLGFLPGFFFFETGAGFLLTFATLLCCIMLLLLLMLLSVLLVRRLTDLELSGGDTATASEFRDEDEDGDMADGEDVADGAQTVPNVVGWKF